MWTRAKLEALEDAMQRGVLSISREGENVTYASFEDMRAAYEYGLSQVEKAATGTAKPRSRIIRIQQTGTGYE